MEMWLLSLRTIHAGKVRFRLETAAAAVVIRAGEDFDDGELGRYIPCLRASRPAVP
ncbi:MAG TPA: hypothetical protein VJQ60_09230 [Arthrobacter sp.]|nr:hypothetical protein [Arthrobacter sp.]